MIPSDAYNILSDGDKNTCIWNDKLTIDLKDAYYIRWMRLRVNYPKHLNNLRICFRNIANKSIKGSTYNKIFSSGQAIDIQLQVTDRIRYIQIEGYRPCQICLLRISGGRNVALKQSSNQSSTYNDGSNTHSSNAVDGNTVSEYTHRSCSHTDHNDGSPTWSLSLHTTRLISRIVLYNINRDRVRLQKFILKLFDENENEVFSYQDTSTTAQINYTVIPDVFVQAKTLTITATDRSQGLFLALCEVEIYSEDLVTSVHASMIPSDAYNILSDGVKNTCIWNDKLTIDLKNAYYIRWMRLIVNYPKHLNNLRICFRNNANKSIKGSTYNKIFSSGQAIDIQLQVTDRIRYIQIEGYRPCQICLLRISGGRNVALKQSTDQSSTYNDGSNTHSSNAVDGNTDSEYSHGSCSHTDHNDGSPTWSLSLHTTRLISRIVLYNKNRDRFRLQTFILKLFGENENEVFSYQDTSTTAQMNYTVIPDVFVQAKTLSITATDRSQGLFLALCEVEIYSDCPMGRWGFECYNECKACDGSCRFDDGTCGAILSGDHLQCTKSCNVGYYGTNCTSPCPKNCKAGECDVQSGHCNEGCIAGYDGGFCENDESVRKKDGSVHVCGGGYYGEDCKYRCSDNCHRGSYYCSPVNGSCNFGCTLGYKPPTCQSTCDVGNYGTNCSSPCPTNCRTDECDVQSGQCTGGCKDGYDGIKCEKELTKCGLQSYFKEKEHLN
ncbi:hypothetical protein Btru_075814 [Bulinus truncatus]|nr:hypothetical protein Btru_075814 [Bulinus truncatus]